MADTITPLALAARIGPGRLFVKLDIEGGEYELLPSMRPLVDRADCMVLVSFHPGILATVMPDAAQREAATARALEIFSGFRRKRGAQRPCRRRPDPAAISAGAAPDKWLFVRD